jgi:hypothetical protein
MATQRYEKVKLQAEEWNADVPSLTWKSYREGNTFFNFGPDVVLVPLGQRPSFEDRIALHIRSELRRGCVPFLTGPEQFWPIKESDPLSWIQYQRLVTELLAIGVLRNGEFLCIRGHNFAESCAAYRQALGRATARRRRQIVLDLRLRPTPRFRW